MKHESPNCMQEIIRDKCGDGEVADWRESGEEAKKGRHKVVRAFTYLPLFSICYVMRSCIKN